MTTANGILDAPALADMGAALRTGEVPAYLGQIATGCMHPTDLNAGIATNFQCRSPHYVQDDTTSIQIAFANNRGDTETGPGANLTVRAAIEYPIGTMTAVTWSGVRDVVAASGADTVLSDPLPINIPRRSLVYVRSLSICSGGVSFRSMAAAAGNLHSNEYSTSALTDKTLSGTIGTPGGHSAILTPILIVGQTTRNSFWVSGDSLSRGTGETIDDVGGAEGAIARSLNPYFAYLINAIGGGTLANLLSNGTRRLARMQYFSHIISGYGANDLNSAGAFAGFLTNLQALKVIAGSKPLLTVLPTPRSSSSDNWATVANQTTNAIYQAERLKFMQAVRTGSLPYIADYIDIAAAVESSPDSGLWKPGLVFLTDALGTHANTPGYLAMMQSRCIDPARIALAKG